MALARIEGRGSIVAVTSAGTPLANHIARGGVQQSELRSDRHAIGDRNDDQGVACKHSRKAWKDSHGDVGKGQGPI